MKYTKTYLEYITEGGPSNGSTIKPIDGLKGSFARPAGKPVRPIARPAGEPVRPTVVDSAISSWKKRIKSNADLGPMPKYVKYFYDTSKLSKSEYVNAYIEHKFIYSSFYHKDPQNIDDSNTIFTDNTLDRNHWESIKKRHLSGKNASRTLALYKNDPNKNYTGKNLTLGEIISNGMKAINGIAPQKNGDGHWINPNNINTSFGIEDIKINDYDKN